MTPTDLDFASALHHEAAAYAARLRAADLDAPVPACPGWSVTRLTDHLGRVHRNVSQMTSAPDAEAGRWTKLPHGPEGPAIVDWFVEGATQLEADLATFAAANAVDATADADAATVPTWAGPQLPTFWPRRMAHETAVHRWDLESATTASANITPVDATLAADGIDEFFEVFTTHRLRPESLDALGEVALGLVAHDLGSSWRVTSSTSGISCTRTDRDAVAADLVVEGSASSLVLFLWGRVAVDGLVTTGSDAVGRRWQEIVTF